MWILYNNSLADFKRREDFFVLIMAFQFRLEILILHLHGFLHIIELEIDCDEQKLWEGKYTDVDQVTAPDYNHRILVYW